MLCDDLRVTTFYLFGLLIIMEEVEEEQVSSVELRGCPSETVSFGQCPVVVVDDVFGCKSMAGKADICQGCPGRQLCLSQGMHL